MVRGKETNREKAKIPDKENQQARAVGTLRDMVRGDRAKAKQKGRKARSTREAG